MLSFPPALFKRTQLLLVRADGGVLLRSPLDFWRVKDNDGSSVSPDCWLYLPNVLCRQVSPCWCNTHIPFRPLEMNYRRIFVLYALPYLLYLESLKPPGIGSGNAEDALFLSTMEGATTTEESETASDGETSPYHGTPLTAVDVAEKEEAEDEQWIYEGGRSATKRRQTQLFNQMHSQQEA
eukprot:Blabericola_migrator_1__1286@NODE_1333_length_4779_cov_9_917869_g895_i0_p3_GENE_NODE_1333_length_4779_cov_9_917869_g895_i0NODE_1333_length_4779_cov_9_917869_g895_i0_p3_ORF_typecomplete_len181_score20_72_NODE_1333_length_4779_cov_9_917869_g895_i022642806